MRKQDKAIIWPAYFDQTKTRKEGRRVPKNIAVQSPKIEEIQEAARTMGLKPEITAETEYPKTPYHKTGRLMVEKKTAKEQVIKKIAKQLIKMRSAPSQQK
jgi:signal recognition particle subunit SRP19